MITIERPLRPETASVGRGTHGSPDIPIQSYSSAPATLLSGRLLCCAVLPCQCHPSPPARPAACPFRWHRKLKETEEWWHDKPPARVWLPYACALAFHMLAGLHVRPYGRRRLWSDEGADPKVTSRPLHVFLTHWEWHLVRIIDLGVVASFDRSPN